MKFSLLIGFVFSALYFSAQVIEKPTEVPQQEVLEQVEPPMEVQVNNVAMEAAGPRPASFPGGTDSLQAYLTTEIEAFIFRDTNEVFPFGEQVFVVFEVGVQGEIINPMKWVIMHCLIRRLLILSEICPSGYLLPMKLMSLWYLPIA
jgi:hypothetical protein